MKLHWLAGQGQPGPAQSFYQVWVKRGVGMAREVHRLSAKAIEKKKTPGYFCDGGGLYLQVSPSLTKSWIFRFTLGGKSREMGLGSERDVTLALARGKASEARRQLADGIDPIGAREAGRAQESESVAGIERAGHATVRGAGYTRRRRAAANRRGEGDRTDRTG